MKRVSKHCKRLTKATKYAHDNKALIHTHKLDYDTFHIVPYSVSVHGNCADLSSQVGYIGLLTCMTKTLNHSRRTRKSRDVFQFSVLSAEVIAIADLPDYSLFIRKQLELILKHPISVHMLTDSKSLFNIICKGNRTNEKLIITHIYMQQ